MTHSSSTEVARTEQVPQGVDGEQLHMARRRRGLSVPHLARVARRSPWHLYKIESGERHLSLPVYVDVCRAFDIPVGEQLTYTGARGFHELKPESHIRDEQAETGVYIPKSSDGHSL